MNYTKQIESYLELEIQILKKLDVELINKAMQLIIETYEKEGRIYIFGNGGSSSTASHFQTDFNKGISEKLRKKFHFCCLNDNIPTLMAIANDLGFEKIFQMQLEGNLLENDIIIAISGSGNSTNIINAVEYAKASGNKIIGITGYNGGKLKELADISLHVDINSMQIAEDVHMIFDHLMMSIFNEVLCGIKHIKE